MQRAIYLFVHYFICSLTDWQEQAFTVNVLFVLHDWGCGDFWYWSLAFGCTVSNHTKFVSIFFFTGLVAMILLTILIQKFNTLERKVIKRVLNLLWLSNNFFCVILYLCFDCNMHPPLHSLSPPTGNRWEVKGVTCGGSGLLPLACQRLITHAAHRIPGGSIGEGGTSQLGAITGAVRAHTHTHVSMHEHISIHEPCSWWELSRVTLSHLWPFLCPS